MRVSLPGFRKSILGSARLTLVRIIWMIVAIVVHSPPEVYQPEPARSRNDTETYKGEIVKKVYLRLLLVLVGLAGFGLPAKGQATDELRVKIPFPFVAAGHTFPAGEYTLIRLRDIEPRILLLSSRENPSNNILLRVDEEEASTGKTRLNFVAEGDQNFLTRIETLNRTYHFQVPRNNTLLAAAPQRGMAAPATSGSN